VALRKEHVVLTLTVVLVGYLAWSSLSGTVAPRSRSSSTPPPFVHHAAPDPKLVMPQAGNDAARARELFAPPSDTQPLPPLDLVTPPHVSLALLRPPPEPGPSTKLFGRFLRDDAKPFEAPDLFAQETAGDEAPDSGATSSSGTSPTPGVPRASAAPASANASQTSVTAGSAAGAADLSPQEQELAKSSWLASIYRILEGRPEGEVRVGAMLALSQVSGAPFKSLREEDWQAWWFARPTGEVPTPDRSGANASGGKGP